MAAPPSYVAHALAGLDAPLVIWNGPTIDRLPDGLTQAQATVNSSQVAAVMLANALVREARPFATVTASPSDADGTARLVRTVRAAAVASVLRGASVLRVGQWLPGYLDVESTAAELARLGVGEHAVDVEELDEAFEAVAAERVEGGLADLDDRGWERREGPADERSMRLALALHDLAGSANAVAATVNCHSDVLRWNPQDRDHRVPRSVAPHGRGHPGLLHGRPADRARARARALRSRAGRSTASSTHPSARPA